MNKDDEDFIIDETIPEPDPMDNPNENVDADPSSEASPDKEPKEKRSKLGIALNNIYHFISGDFLTKEGFAKQFPFILYIVFLLMLLVASSYHVENVHSQIRSLTKQIEEYHTQHIYLKAAITKETKQSTLVEKLKYREIKESTQPMKKIEINKNEGEDKP
jgi:hypothetical protein